MVSNKVTVLRSDAHTGYSDFQDIPLDQLVPGDIVKLAAGDMIPADLRILQARDLFISQASLTDESLPVEKVANSRQSDAATALECDTLCFNGHQRGQRYRTGYGHCYRQPHLVCVNWQAVWCNIPVK